MRGVRPTPEQKRARAQMAEARKASLERKKRTRRLIQMGDVLVSYGFESPDQVDELMQVMIGDEENRQWLIEHGVQYTERWPEGND